MTYHNAAAILADPATAVVERAPLTKAFEIVNATVENRNTVPVLSNARLQGDGDMIFITGTDLDIELTVAIPAAADSRFALTLPAGKMRDLLKKATASDFVAFTMPEVEDSERLTKHEWNEVTGKHEPVMEPCKKFTGPATVDFERVKYRLAAIHPSDFPELRGPSPIKSPDYRSFKLTGAGLWTALDSTMVAISTEETRYYLNGIYMHHAASQGDALRFVATDGHRLYRQDLAAPDGCEGMPGVILPRKTVALLHKLMKGKACPASVAVEVQADRIRFMWGDDDLCITLTSKLIDGTFPDYQRVTPSFCYGGNHTATFDPGEMLEAIRAVSLISSERGRAIKITMDRDKIGLDVNNPDMGAAHAEVAGNFDGPGGFEVGYNAAYLVDMIATASPDGATVTWQGTDCGAPAVFTGSRAGWLAVLMPMRV